MTEIQLQDAYRVEIIESERGWSTKVDEVKYFDSETAAKEFVTDYNNKWNPPCTDVPDWYMVAHYIGKVQ